MEDKLSRIEEVMQLELRKGEDVESLMGHAGWKHLVQALEEDAIDGWLELRKVDPHDYKEIEKQQRKIECYSMLLEKSAEFLMTKSQLEEAAKMDNEIE